jgi:hypothetical protein
MTRGLILQLLATLLAVYVLYMVFYSLYKTVTINIHTMALFGLALYVIVELWPIIERVHIVYPILVLIAVVVVGRMM